MTLIAIILATLAAGIGSVWVAALLMRAGWGDGRSGIGPRHLLSFAAGALLATAFMHLLPEAFESQAGAHELFATLLVGLVFFFLLDKAELWHHGHEHGVGPANDDPGTGGGHVHSHGHTHHGHGHGHGHHAHAHGGDGGHAHSHRGSGGWALLTGDSVHCFGDGILIASAFLADLRLGAIAALAVLAHEVPHHMGDLVVLRQSSGDRRAALVKVSLAGAVTALGGVVGYFLVGELQDWLPYFLAIASSSFVYVALADLIPQLQKRLTAKQTLAQIAWLLGGMVVVTLVSGMAHAH
ncbi:ZIP family metal transporter [Acidovorax sp. NCPPB 3859]|nr:MULTISPECIES: ZIP family metal transporter [unclassified Acidovorax]MDA8450586.1 ZIP family metal transporter [Acidovorax sp. GBBC 3297]MDA8460047.1 ZIP family metal transporter [Acidovorax sp. GBBC 3333]MDA8465083.1 ZIP family metal transporter [Acidovorax sp. GBBC 3332]MDA8470101.1 ZIP family metal transporter [Acidovorax sp. GBBC 3299]WCM77197.1 ZIP family metal transporter [Acidovorax sp. GBBC 712]